MNYKLDSHLTRIHIVGVLWWGTSSAMAISADFDSYCFDFFRFQRCC